MRISQPIFKILTLILAISVIAGFAYIASQQVLRQDANDPQIQIVEDASAAFSAGQQVPTQDAAGTQTDIAKSLSTFIVIYNSTGTAVFSTGVLNDAAPVPPKGVLDTAAKGEVRVTWQPQKGLRYAIVAAPYTSSDGSGVVLAGRSLREVERREMILGIQFLLAWILSVFILLAGSFLPMLLSMKKKDEPVPHHPMHEASSPMHHPHEPSPEIEDHSAMHDHTDTPPSV
ncbi:MAG: hypothetical protein WC477_05340 [Patescibacteria group bacterium]